MSVAFAEAKEARRFVQANCLWLADIAKLGAYQASKGKPSDEQALTWAAALIETHPHLAKSLKRKALKPVKCERCGTILTAPESIAARIGPECMAK